MAYNKSTYSWGRMVEENPEILINSWQDWSEFTHYFARIFDNTNVDKVFIKNLSDSLTHRSSDPFEMFRKIYDFVRKQISYKKFVAESGLIPQEIDNTLKYGIGDCKAKSKLAYHLLKAQDISADFVLTHTKNYYKLRKHPKNVFNHIFLRILLEGDTLYLDGTLKDSVNIKALPKHSTNKDILIFNSEGYEIKHTNPFVRVTKCSDDISLLLEEDGELLFSLKGYLVNSRFSPRDLALTLNYYKQQLLSQNIIKFEVKQKKDTTFYEIQIQGLSKLYRFNNEYKLLFLRIIRPYTYMFKVTDIMKKYLGKELAHKTVIKLKYPVGWVPILPKTHSKELGITKSEYRYQYIDNEILFETNKSLLFFEDPRQFNDEAFFILFEEKK